MYFKRRRTRRHIRRKRAALALLVLLAVALLIWWYAHSRGEPNVVARVLFAETASCSSRERALVAAVMRNRIRNPAFGNLPTLQAVVLQRGAFSCIGDADNGNWLKTLHPGTMTTRERAVWADCIAIANGSISAAVGPSGRPLVYYHDKSIGKPASWDNAKWHAVREEVTEHFVFYSIVAAGR